MPASAGQGYAYNQTRQSYLATDLRVAQTYWSRLRGLLGRERSLPPGKGLWIVPCRGVHTLAMRFPIDVVYLDKDKVVVLLKENMLPWRLAPLCWKAASVLELPTQTVDQTQTCLGDRIDIGFDSRKGRR